MALLRMITAGESHGPGLVCVLEGMPAGLVLDRAAIDRDLTRRQLGHGRGGRMKIEQDSAAATGGIRHGRTLGGPIALTIANRDYENWVERMDPWGTGPVEEVHLPRPGHADLAGVTKFGLSDVRDVLERASARETAARVAGGAVCRAFLRALGVEVVSHVRRIGTVESPAYPEPLGLERFAAVDASPVRCLDEEASAAMVEHINVQRRANESLGGVFEVRAYGLVAGLGSHVSWEERLDGRLAGALCSIQSVKGVGLGEGFALAAKPGSFAHDEIFHDAQRGFYRETNRSGGLEGGMTTGEPLIVTAAMKPLPTLTKPLRSVDIATLEPAEALRERTDSCTVPAGGVVGEAMVAFVLADAYRRKFGGDHIDDVRAALAAYRERIPVKAGGAIVLIGFMGAGKTTAARDLAALRGLRAHDADQLIEARAARTVPEIFASDGEPAFRALEEVVVCELLDSVAAGDVVALSGGAIGSAAVRDALRAHLVVWLEVDVKLAWRRIGGGRRPLARDRGAFEALHACRAATYAALADAIVPAGARDALPRAYDAVEQLRLAPAGARLLWAVSGSAEYPVWIGRGLLGSGVWPLPRPPSRRFCVTDRNVAGLWGASLGELDGQIVIEPGEQHKTLAAAERVWSELAATGMTRADHLVALGGGVVGDIAGFCAATYQRGVPVVQAPTTLVAQVDSAYGGKTGVDLPAAKNYVGAYHQPAGVLVDPAVLDTLPAAELAAGYAELLKTALIAGGSLWQRVAEDRPLEMALIVDCVRCKLSIVAQDEHDTGRRQVLNLGHTVGHAIETATGYTRYRHGEAVGLGLLVALELSGQRELRDRVAGLLAAHGLPTHTEGVDPAAVIAASRRDKKRRGDEVPFVLLDGPGVVRHGAHVAPGELEAAVAALCG